MRKQTGIIYSKDLTNSHSKTIHHLEIPEQQTTVRKSSAVISASISIKNSQCTDSRQSKVSKTSGKLASNSNPTSWKNDFSSETSRQFSSIHESSMLSHESSHPCIEEKENNSQNFCRSKKGSSVESYHENESYFSDSLAIYENPLTKNDEMVSKLLHLNNIFKEIKSLRMEKLNKDILVQINETERELIEMEKNILRN